MFIHVIKMDIEAIFQFVAENPPTALIVGGILFITLSVLTITIDPSTTEFLRTAGSWSIGLGVLLQALWLVLRRN